MGITISVVRQMAELLQLEFYVHMPDCNSRCNSLYTSTLLIAYWVWLMLVMYTAHAYWLLIQFVVFFLFRLLFVKIDKDGDSRVSPDELQSWMRHIQQQSMEKETNKQWSELNPADPNLLTWNEYAQHTYNNDKST